jgi:uncharacterized membrane protein (DUF2068 family)
MDWNRRRCARRGHVLYEPTEPEVRDRIRTDTAVGTAWRCLRCGDFVLERPKAAGPAADAPAVPRGKALRSLMIMRLLAVERLFRFVLVGAIAFAVWRFSNSQRALSDLFETDVALFRPIARHWGFDLDHSPIVDTIRKSFHYKHSTLTAAAIVLAVYAVIELIEAVGLWLAKRWGEYFAAVATAAFIPIEVFEIIDKQSVFKIATLAVNVLAVVYLLLAKRLFGLRGGKAAAERELHSASLLEVDQAAVTQAAVPAERVEASTVQDPAYLDASGGGAIEVGAVGGGAIDGGGLVDAADRNVQHSTKQGTL